MGFPPRGIFSGARGHELLHDVGDVVVPSAVAEAVAVVVFIPFRRDYTVGSLLSLCLSLLFLRPQTILAS